MTKFICQGKDCGKTFERTAEELNADFDRAINDMLGQESWTVNKELFCDDCLLKNIHYEK